MIMQNTLLSAHIIMTSNLRGVHDNILTRVGFDNESIKNTGSRLQKVGENDIIGIPMRGDLGVTSNYGTTDVYVCVEVI